jgi:hypothetical protein
MVAPSRPVNHPGLLIGTHRGRSRTGRTGGSVSSVPAPFRAAIASYFRAAKVTSNAGSRAMFCARSGASSLRRGRPSQICGQVMSVESHALASERVSSHSATGSERTDPDRYAIGDVDHSELPDDDVRPPDALRRFATEVQAEHGHGNRRSVLSSVAGAT